MKSKRSKAKPRTFNAGCRCCNTKGFKLNKLNRVVYNRYMRLVGSNSKRNWIGE